MKTLSSREWIFFRLLFACLAMACIATVWTSLFSGQIEFGTRRHSFVLTGDYIWIGQALWFDAALLAMFLSFFKAPPNPNSEHLMMAAKLTAVVWFMLFLVGFICADVVP